MNPETVSPAMWLFAAVFACAAPAALAQETAWPRTIQHQAGELTLASQPLRIVSTTPSVTGILLAMEAPVIASAATTPSILTDDKGFFSSWAAIADQRGVEVLYPNLEFDIEAVIAWDPDLLIVSSTGADSVLQHYAEIEAQNIPALVVDYSDTSWQELATRLGQALGLEEEAAAAIARFDAYAKEAAASITPPAGRVSLLGYNIAGSYSISSPESPQARLLTDLGFDVAGLPDELAGAVTGTSNFDFISRENLSAAITGETVFLMRGTEADAEAFRADPLLANLPAVTGNRVYPLGPASFRVDYYSGRELIDTVVRQFR